MENKRLYGMLCAIQRGLSRQNNDMFSGCEITPVQMHVLMILHKAEKSGRSVCQRDIERELSMRPSSVSSIFSILEKAGFVTRGYTADDARTKIASLTESGRALCVKNKLMFDKCDATISAAISEDEQRELFVIFEKILTYIKEND